MVIKETFFPLSAGAAGMEAHKVHDRIEGHRFDHRRNRAGGGTHS